MSDTLKRAEELLAGITPGEWELRKALPYSEHIRVFVGYGKHNHTICEMHWFGTQPEKDAAFIAAAPSLVRELVAEVKELRQLKMEAYEVHQTLVAENKALREELETERMRLAACGVAAMGNTLSTVNERISSDSPYYSASYGDVCRAVAREIALREENAALRLRLDGRTYCHSDEAVNAELAALKERALRFYRADGSYSLAETEEVAINARIAAAFELTALREVVEKVREDCEAAIDYPEGQIPSAQVKGMIEQARDTLSLLPEVPK